MNNLHISLTDFKNESRVLKETASLLQHNIANQVYVAALYENDVKENQIYESGIIVKRFKLTTRNLSKNLFVQILKYLEFIFRIIFFYRDKNIKIVNIHSIALLPLGVMLKYIYKAKLIYDTHELETETNGSRGMRKKLSKLLEKTLIEYVDITFVVSENIANWYENEYNMQRPIVVLNAPKLVKPKQTNHFRKSLGIKKDSIIVLYQGGLSDGRGVELLLETFKLRDNDKIVIVFMGYGKLEDLVKNYANKYNNIFYYSAVSPDIVLDYTSSADIGVSFIENTCLSYYYCMPNKLFEYAMAGLPVIVSNMKDMSEIVKKYNMGIIVKEKSIESLDTTINKILTLNIKQMKNNARKCAEDNTWNKQEIKMINEYKRILDEK